MKCVNRNSEHKHCKHDDDDDDDDVCVYGFLGVSVRASEQMRAFNCFVAVCVCVFCCLHIACILNLSCENEQNTYWVMQYTCTASDINIKRMQKAIVELGF